MLVDACLIAAAGLANGRLPWAQCEKTLVVSLVPQEPQEVRRLTTRPLSKRQAAAQLALARASTRMKVVSRFVKRVHLVTLE